MKMVDFSPCLCSARMGYYGGQAGLKDGIVYNGEYYIAKYPKTTKSMDVKGISYTTSPLSEYIGSHIYELLGYDVHQTVLGYRNGKIVVGCKDFCEKGENLLEVRTLKNQATPELAEMLEKEIQSSSSNHYVDLKEILLHLEHNPILSVMDGIKERFWDQVVIDIFINNNDRNNGNWGLITNENTGSRRIAPIYDNGAAFSPKVSDKTLEIRNNNYEYLKESSLGGVTVYAIDDVMITSREMLSYDFPGLENAIKKNVPLIRKVLPEIENMINEIPEKFLGLDVCSPIRKENYINALHIRLNELLMPAYNRVMGLPERKTGRRNSIYLDCIADLKKDSLIFESLKTELKEMAGDRSRSKEVKSMISAINNIKNSVFEKAQKAISEIGVISFQKEWDEKEDIGVSLELKRAVTKTAKDLQNKLQQAYWEVKEEEGQIKEANRKIFGFESQKEVQEINSLWENAYNNNPGLKRYVDEIENQVDLMADIEDFPVSEKGDPQKDNRQVDEWER